MKVFLLTFFLAITHLGFPQSGLVFNTNGVAIGGFDPVAYFLENKPVKGDESFNYSWQGAKWYFKSQNNLEAFKNSPEKYAPQFGGYCAFGTMKNYKAQTDPAAFTIVDGKLYLNYNLRVKELWLKDTIQNIRQAEANWITLKDKNQ